MVLTTRIRLIAALGTALGMLALASQAEAHARLVSATPPPGSTVPAPRQLLLHFSEALAPKFSSFDLTKADGGKVTLATHVAPKDHKTLVGVVSGPLAPGGYRVMWRASAADDGHRTQGQFSFTVS